MSRKALLRVRLFTAVNVATSVSYKRISDANGNYAIPLIPPGDYVVEVSAASFSTLKRSGITLQVNQVMQLDLSLQAGSASETASSPQINFSTSAVATVIDNQKVTQLSLNGRSVYSLQGLVPGPVPDNTGRIRFNNVRSRSNEILIDGVSQVPPETRGDPV